MVATKLAGTPGARGGGDKKGSEENERGGGAVGVHKDESAGARITPTNQSDSGWKARLA